MNVKDFLSENKKIKENAFVAVSASFLDENGEPIKWEIKPLTAVENEIFKKECIQIVGENTNYDFAKMNRLQMVASVVYPDLHNAELQDSYKVKTPEDLLGAMLDCAGDYQRLANFITEFNNLGAKVEEKLKIAKK